jgi:hypothetical protein
MPGLATLSNTYAGGQLLAHIPKLVVVGQYMSYLAFFFDHLSTCFLWGIRPCYANLAKNDESAQPRKLCADLDHCRLRVRYPVLSGSWQKPFPHLHYNT